MWIKLYIIPVVLLISNTSFAAEPDTAFNHQFRKDIGGWIAADATFSILLPDGRTLWLFGDTFIGEVNENNEILPGSKFIRNSAVIQDGDNLQTLYRESESQPSAFIPTQYPDSLWYWPEHGWVENDTLRIFTAKFRSSEDAPEGFNFEHAGNDIANFSYPDLEFINTVEVKAHPENEVFYGDRILEYDGYLYIYGRRYDDPEVNIVYPHAARAKLGELMLQDWEYYDGEGWSADPLSTKRINSDPVSQQYSVTTYREKFILLTQDIWLSPKIYTYTAETPVGPWKNKKLIYETPETDAETFTYNAYAHPQFNRDQELLVSYNVNGDFWSIFSNVEIYRPRFIRVPYMNLDYAFWPNSTQTQTINEKKPVTAFPNPVNDRLVVSIQSDKIISPDMKIIDMHGAVVNTFTLNLQPGINHCEFEMSYLQSGIYLCQIPLNEKLEIIKLIKNDQSY